MTNTLYHGFRFPKPIIQHAIWLYLRFTLSLRDVEELLAERGMNVTYETIRAGSRGSGRCSPSVCAAVAAHPVGSGISMRCS
jgi:transposase-like protein